MEAHKISVHEALENADMELEDCEDSTVPACCSEGCWVEPDGTCEHGFKSVLLEMGLI